MANVATKLIVAIFIFFSYCHQSWCQLMIDSVTITDKPYAQARLKADYEASKMGKNSITDFVQSIQSGQVHLSTPGGLTSFLHRGMGHRHLSIQWQGVNIQNTMNGSYDLSLVPIFLMEGTSFYTIGNPSIQGNNSLAGVLSLQSPQTGLNGFKVYLSGSSMRNIGSGAIYRVHNKKIAHEMGIDYSYDKNIFSYTHNHLKLERSPTDFERTNIISNSTILLSNNQSFRCNLWFQDAHRKIPVSTTSAFTDQTQHDKNIRLQFSHTYYRNKQKIQSTYTYMHENLDFRTPALDSKSLIATWLANIQYTHLTKNEWHANIQFRKDIASPNFYPTVKTRSNLQAAGSKKIMWNEELFTQISLRQDLIDSKWMPLSWNIYTKVKKTTFSINSNYQLPGLNDLYWPSGGNPKLKMEHSYQTELKSEFAWNEFTIYGATYLQLVADWIQWLPGINGQFSPINQKKVIGRGIDIKLDKSFFLKKWKIMALTYFHFNRTYAIDHYTNPSLVGKQLIFVPKHKAGASLNAQFKNHHLSIQYQYIGKRFDTPDESQILKPIHLFHFSYQLSLNQLQIELQTKNLFNYQYEITRYFPMPGIHFNIKFIYNILK